MTIWPCSGRCSRACLSSASGRPGWCWPAPRPSAAPACSPSWASVSGVGPSPRSEQFVRYSKRIWLLCQTEWSGTDERRAGGMGIEGRDKQKALEAGATALSGQLGKSVQRLRKAYNLSLSELSEQSGVAKSIISQIERNETNPTLATIWRLAHALDVSIERVLQAATIRPSLNTCPRATRRFSFGRRQVPARHHRLDQDGGMAAMLRFSRRSRRRAGIRRPPARLRESLTVIQRELQWMSAARRKSCAPRKPCATGGSPPRHPQRRSCSGPGEMICILKAAAME